MLYLKPLILIIEASFQLYSQWKVCPSFCLGELWDRCASSEAFTWVGEQHPQEDEAVWAATAEVGGLY